jgi:outer membrane protein assembly factor BamA
MNIRRIVQGTIIALAVMAVIGVIAPGQTCFAQTTGEGEVSKENPAPETPAAPTPQAGDTISKITGRFSTRERGAPDREEIVAFNLGNKHLNAITGGFGQGAGLPMGLEFTTANSVKWVEFRVSALTSTKLYRRFEAGAYIPVIGDENTHAEVWVSYLRRTEDNFYGIGPRFPKDFQTNFDLEQRSVNATFYHNFAKALQAGVYARVANSGTFNGNDIPMDQLFPGSLGALPASRLAPGFQTNTRILSYGAYGSFDRRDNNRGLTRGFYLYGRFASADGLDYDEKPGFQNFKQDYGWLETELDGRAYIPLFSDRTSLAIRAFSELKSPKGGSQIPFYDLSYLGGRSELRGFPNFRFRGDNSLLFSGELRQTVWRKSESAGLDVFGFTDVGQVWGDNRSKTDPAVLQNVDFDSGNWRTGAGGGVQYRLSKAFAFRVEMGHSNERSLLYFSFSRGF